MTSFFRRAHEQVRPDPPAGPPVGDTPAGMRKALRELVSFINVNAGRLPVESVVSALGVTDTISEVIDTSDDDELDIYAIVSVRGIIDDYLPTTLHAYLALDSTTVDTPRPSGRSPKASLLEQIDALWLTATDVLVAARARDADALLTQGNFLRTKFAGSDLDL
jgi:hypothetical protein